MTRDRLSALHIESGSESDRVGRTHLIPQAVRAFDAMKTKCTTRTKTP